MPALGTDDVSKILRRVLSHGPLANLPKRRSDLNVFLALSAVQLIRDDALDEAHVNTRLQSWLSSVCSPNGIDHVTVRRYLVDARFVERDRGGAVYRVNEQQVDRIIDRAAREIKPDRILAQIAEERAARKRQYQLGQSGEM